MRKLTIKSRSQFLRLALLKIWCALSICAVREVAWRRLVSCGVYNMQQLWISSTDDNNKIAVVQQLFFVKIWIWITSSLMLKKLLCLKIGLLLPISVASVYRDHHHAIQQNIQGSKVSRTSLHNSSLIPDVTILFCMEWNILPVLNDLNHKSNYSSNSFYCATLKINTNAQ